MQTKTEDVYVTKLVGLVTMIPKLKAYGWAVAVFWGFLAGEMASE